MNSSNIAADWLDFEDDVVRFSKPKEEIRFINSLVRRIGEEARPNINLIYSIIKRAARSADAEYFSGAVGKKHCELLGLDSLSILETIEGKNLCNTTGRTRQHWANVKLNRDNIRKHYESGTITKRALALKWKVCLPFLDKILDGCVGGKSGISPICGGELIKMVQDRMNGLTYQQISIKYHREKTRVREAIQAQLPKGFKLPKRKNNFNLDLTSSF